MSLISNSFSQVDNNQFNSAEERIVYNKANQLDRYEGVLIEYVFEIESDANLLESELTAHASTLFSKYINSLLYTLEHTSYFAVITEGDLENHSLVQDLERAFDFELSSTERRYHLIQSHD